MKSISTHSSVFVTVLTLTLHQQIIHCSGYGTSSGSRATSAPSEPDYEEEQWGGVGHGQAHDRYPSQSGTTEYYDSDRWGTSPPPGRGRPNDKYDERRPTASSQSGSGTYDPRSANYFARESHVERYGHPEGCVKDEKFRDACNYYVEIVKDAKEPESLHFELATNAINADQGGYVAVGLSPDDDLMGDDHIVECVKQPDGRFSWYSSWSQKRNTPDRLPHDRNVIQMDATFPQFDNKKKRLTCKFRRPISTVVEAHGKHHFFNLEQGNYYVLLATGNLQNSDSDTIGYHGKPTVTGNAFASREPMGRLEFSKSKPGTHHVGYKNAGSGYRFQLHTLTILVLCLLPYFLF